MKNNKSNILKTLHTMYNEGETLQEFESMFYSHGGDIIFPKNDDSNYAKITQPDWLKERLKDQLDRIFHNRCCI